jgi:CBS domain-containing protein
MIDRPIPRTVADVMTRDVTTLDENDSLEQLLESMHLLHFRHTPVVDEDRVIGLLSERDVLKLSASSLLPHAKQQNEFLQRRFFVRDAMVRDVCTVPPDTLLKDAAAVMLERRIDCLPVVNAEGGLVGILTSTDLMRVVKDFAPAS